MTRGKLSNSPTDIKSRQGSPYTEGKLVSLMTARCVWFLMFFVYMFVKGALAKIFVTKILHLKVEEIL